MHKLCNVHKPKQYHKIFLFFFLQMRLGLIIDLTNTNRFYDKTVVERTGIKHIKMQLKGFGPSFVCWNWFTWFLECYLLACNVCWLLCRHGETPSPEQVALFIRMCDRYFDQNPGELIGLWIILFFSAQLMIISFMVFQLPEQAIARFNLFLYHYCYE